MAVTNDDKLDLLLLDDRHELHKILQTLSEQPRDYQLSLNEKLDPHCRVRNKKH